jgi:hypothetical protein
MSDLTKSPNIVHMACGHGYDPDNVECQVTPLIGVDGKPYGSSRCPLRWSYEAEERMRSE